MIAVDTNVLVRLLTGDDPVQESAARSLFASGPIWIAKTVLLETSWVLRRTLHVSSRPAAAKFVSFDKVFVRRTKRVGLTGISEPSGKS